MMEDSGTGRAQHPVRDQAAAIEKAKHELEQMIDMCPQIMLLVGAEGKVLRTNRASLDMLGKTGYAEVLGQPLKHLFDCGDVDLFDQLMACEGAIREMEAEIHLPGRGRHPLKFSLIGRPASEVHVLLIQDVTDAKSYEAEQKHTHRQEAIQELVGALMHTINQHLTVISVRAKLMTMAIEKGEGHPEELKRGLADITDLTLKIADTLSDVGKPREFNTVSYINGLDILDIESPATPKPND